MDKAMLTRSAISNVEPQTINPQKEIKARHLRDTLHNSDDTKGHSEKFEMAKVTFKFLFIP